MCVITLNRETQQRGENHFQSHIKVVRWNAFLPTWSLKIFEITTGTLCSAPPWKAGEKDEDVHYWVWVVKFAAKTAFLKQPSLPPKAFHFHCSLKTYLLTLMLKPRPPVTCLRSTTVLCFRKWEFLIGKRILWTLKSMLELCGMNYKTRAWRPRVHLHLLGIHFHSCKPHPASVWLIPLWSISGRHHRYCWSPHCTAKQFQILSVGIEKNIDILPSRAIT